MPGWKPYKNKKTEQPIVSMKKGEFVEGIVDEAIKKDVTYQAVRNMRLLEVAEDASIVRMWISAAVNIHDDSVFFCLDSTALRNTSNHFLCLGKTFKRINLVIALQFKTAAKHKAACFYNLCIL